MKKKKKGRMDGQNKEKLAKKLMSLMKQKQEQREKKERARRSRNGRAVRLDNSRQYHKLRKATMAFKYRKNLLLVTTKFY